MCKIATLAMLLSRRVQKAVTTRVIREGELLRMALASMSVQNMAFAPLLVCRTVSNPVVNAPQLLVGAKSLKKRPASSIL